jgi:hypothetical protein
MSRSFCELDTFRDWAILEQQLHWHGMIREHVETGFPQKRTDQLHPPSMARRIRIRSGPC